MSIEPENQHKTRRNLAEVLRELRRAAGLSGERLAARCSMSQAAISRIETGKTLPSIVDVERILKALKVPPDVARDLLDLARVANVDYVSGRAIARLGLWRRQMELKALTESAVVVRQFLPAIPTGFVQVPEYAELMMTPSVASAPARDVAKAVEARLELRKALDDESRSFHLLMTEQAIRWNYAGSEIMARQVAHIARIAMRPNVEVSVIPFSAEVHDAPMHVFAIFDERLVTVELFNGGVSFRDPRDVAYYLELFQFFLEHALTGSAAIAFLRAVAAEFM